MRVGERELAYDRLVIATGSSAEIPPIRGLDEVEFWTNVEATETIEVPPRLAVLGGGPEAASSPSSSPGSARR